MIKPKKALLNIAPYQTDFYKTDWRLKLDANENIYGSYESVLSMLKNISSEDVSLYPTYGKLIDKISVKYDLPKNYILPANGCDEALSVLIGAYLEEGEEILSFYPTFSMPAIYARISGADVRYIDYDEKFAFDKDKLAKNIRENTKIVYISTPNNPTGEIVRASVVEELIKKFKEVLFILDCTYINFSYNSTFEDYIELAKKYDNTAVVKSFSKDFALAGLRLGAVFANDEIIDNLKKVISPYSVNSIAVNCAMMVLNDDKKMIEIKEMNQKAKELLNSNLSSLGFRPYDSEANFVLCDFGAYCDFYYEKLKKNGIITRNYSKNTTLENCLRITVPTLGGVKYIVSLLSKKDVLAINLDNVIFDVRESYFRALEEVYSHFAKDKKDINQICEIKKLNGIKSDFRALLHILEMSGYEVSFDEIKQTFNDIFYNPNKNDRNLIDNDRLLISKDVFEELSKKYDFVVFSNRTTLQAKYSLEKYDIDKYFYCYLCRDTLSDDELKPSPEGILRLIQYTPYKTIKLFGSDFDDIIAGNRAQIETIGVISPWCDYNLMVNNYRHLGANYILGDIKNLCTFIEECEKDYAKNS